ncbi:MAG TPA: TlpA disulfide reductase family protein [Rhizomicrobium sp.]|nr:TlpA disulfide reductase family protein [Rhizomicrobium sp.]
MSRFLVVMFALLLVLPPAMAANAPAKAPVKLKVGDLAPQFVRGDLQGRMFDLKAQRGKIVLIDFWASWCPPCILAIPHLGQLQKKYGGRGFQVVGVSMDDSADSTKETMQKIPFNYPVVLGDAKFGNLYGGVLGLPLQFLVGADGKILAIWSGEFPPATLDKGITNALKKISPR